MKKLSVLAIAFAVVALAACGGKKSAEAEVATDSLKSFEQQQIEASIKMNLDSLANTLAQCKHLPFLSSDKDGVNLTKEEKQVKPTYLLAPATADEATTLAEKYRTLSALSVDRKIAELYEMPVEDYDKAISKLAADINDPSFKTIEKANSIYETTQELYEAMEKNGRINYFWQLASAALVEQLYAINQNSEKFLSVFTDESAANATFRVILILDAVKRLSQYDPDIKPISDALAPLDVLNATTVGELKSQLKEAEEKIAAARKALIK